MDKGQDGGVAGGRAFVLRTAPRVAALWASIANAYRALIAWLGPFGLAIFGMFLMMVSVSNGRPSTGVALIGGMMILSAMELASERARAKLMRSLATEMWATLRDERKMTFKVEQTYRADHATIAAWKAQAMAARSGETSGSTVGNSAVGNADAPEHNQEQH